MIIVTPGHYSSSVGASYAGFSEYPETVKWARNIRRGLAQKALYVPAQPLIAKVLRINKLCLQYEVSLVVEVHFNSAVNASGVNVGEGSETLYCPGSVLGLAYAQKIQSALARHFPPDRGVKEGWYHRRKTAGPLYLLEKTRCPAIIVEPEFVHRHTLITDAREICCADLARTLLELRQDNSTGFA